jgi:hypothetical protein
MKTMKYFFMAALALMTAACSNEDNEIIQQPQNARGIPFSVTLSMGESAATRALTEIAPTGDNPYGRIDASWESGDQVALIYTVGTTTYKKDVTVTPQADGTATVSTELEGSPENNSEVTIIYPATAADKTTANYIKTGLLEDQDGTLAGIAEKYDVRKGKGKLSITGEGNNKTATVYDDTKTRNLVKLENLYSIFKFSVLDINGEAILGVGMSFTEFKVSDASGNVKATFTGTITDNDVYVALPELTAGKYWFNASVSDGTLNKPYIAKATATATTAGKYYPVTVKMATIGNFILSDGTFSAANPTSGTPVAMIAYLGNATDNNTYKHGLALAMTDEDRGNGMSWSTAKSKCDSKTTPSVGNNTGTSLWLFPSEAQWTNMDDHVRKFFHSYGLCSAFNGITGATNLLYSESTTEHILYWSSTEVKVGESYTSARAFDAYTPYWYDDSKANGAVTPYNRCCRACIAF